MRAFGQTCARAIRTRFPQDAKQENVQLKDENAMLRRLVGGPRYRDSKPAGDRGLSASGQRRACPQTAKSGRAGEVALLDPELRKEMGEDQWSPGFVDYLFLAFNTSTAFSPTDVPVLSRWAKTLMMVQASISLATIALLAARAVNIL